MSEEHRVPVDPLTLPGKLRASIEAAAEEMDAKRGLPDALVAELRASGIFRLHTPRELGGAEASSVTVMRVYEELGRINASAAWVVANGNTGLLASRMEQAGIDRIWGTGTEPVFANSTGRPGAAIPVEGGYRVSGHYKVISGIGAADWLWAAVVNVDDSRDVRYAALHRDDWSVQDTWDTTGARGTGSHDVLVEDAFVPSELAVDLSRPTLINRPLYRGLARRFTMPGASAVALGVAQQAIEEIILLAPTKRTVTGSTLAELPHAQSTLARTEVAVRAAHHLFYSVLGELDEAAERDEKETVEDLATLRATMNHVADVCREALISMYKLGSSSAIYRGEPLERLFRDGMALLQHAIVSDTVMEAVGRIRLGMDPGMKL